MVCCNRTRGNGFKLKDGQFRLGIRKKRRVVKQWNRSPTETVDAPFLEVLNIEGTSDSKVHTLQVQHQFRFKIEQLQWVLL